MNWYTVTAMPKDGSTEYIIKEWYALTDNLAIDTMMIFLSMELGLDSYQYDYVVEKGRSKDE